MVIRFHATLDTEGCSGRHHEQTTLSLTFATRSTHVIESDIIQPTNQQSIRILSSDLKAHTPHKRVFGVRNVGAYKDVPETPRGATSPPPGTTAMEPRPNGQTEKRLPFQPLAPEAVVPNRLECRRHGARTRGREKELWPSGLWHKTTANHEEEPTS